MTILDVTTGSGIMFLSELRKFGDSAEYICKIVAGCFLTTNGNWRMETYNNMMDRQMKCVDSVGDYAENV